MSLKSLGLAAVAGLALAAGPTTGSMAATSTASATYTAYYVCHAFYSTYSGGDFIISNIFTADFYRQSEIDYRWQNWLNQNGYVYDNGSAFCNVHNQQWDAETWRNNQINHYQYQMGSTMYYPNFYG